jgi:hypothetical protein
MTTWVTTTSSTVPNLSRTYWSTVVEVLPGGDYGVAAAVETLNSEKSSVCQGYSIPVTDNILPLGFASYKEFLAELVTGKLVF